jgi:hypothetical protein
LALRPSLALRETGTPSLLVALDYLEPFADVRRDKFDRAAVRGHGRLELESAVLTIAESQLALAALGALRAGHNDAAEIRFAEVLFSTTLGVSTLG